MDQQPKANRRKDEDRRLRWDSKNPLLAKDEKGLRKIDRRRNAMGERFGQTAKQRKGSQRDDQRRQAQPRNEERVEGAGERTHGKSARDGSNYRQPCVMPQFAEEHGAQPQS